MKDDSRIEHVKHHLPQIETMKPICDNSEAKKILNWAPKISIKEGISSLEKWIRETETIK